MITYSKLMEIESFEDRLNTLREAAQGAPQSQMVRRDISVLLYKLNPRWQVIREMVMSRDNVCDLAIFGKAIDTKIIVHHIDPLTESDILHNHPKCLDPDNLITTSIATHNKIHYSKKEIIMPPPTVLERMPDDTKLW